VILPSSVGHLLPRSGTASGAAVVFESLAL
jgi:hypothetical protein